jgi:hypothetical protein
MSESFGFMVYQFAFSTLYIFNHVFVQKCERGFVIAYPGASLRSVNSPTRAIIAVISSKNLLDFRRTCSLTFHDCCVHVSWTECAGGRSCHSHMCRRLNFIYISP